MSLPPTNHIPIVWQPVKPEIQVSHFLFSVTFPQRKLRVVSESIPITEDTVPPATGLAVLK
jgi:hypothetical protein